MSLIAKKTGVYSRIHEPVRITDLKDGCVVMMKDESVLDDYPMDDEGCYIVGNLPITKQMETALGGMLTVDDVDTDDDTFIAYVGNDWFWWPLELVAYVI